MNLLLLVLGVVFAAVAVAAIRWDRRQNKGRRK